MSIIENLLKEKSSWEKLKESSEPVIIYGTGNGADRVLDEFERLGIKASGVIASKGFVRSRNFRGFRVQSLEDIENQYSSFTLALSFASAVPEVMDNIKRICGAHRIIMPVVPVFGNLMFNREYIEDSKDALSKSMELLADEESKRVFEGMVKFQYTGELSYLFEIESSREDALKNLLCLGDKEDMLDLGAYRGDTVEEIISLFGGISSALCFEPDAKTFSKLTAFAESKKNVTALPYAVWHREEELSFSGGGGRQSALSTEGKHSVKAVAVDSIIGERKITYVKADVEGTEKEAICGMKNLLRTQKPKLSVAVYHRTEDLCTLIPIVKSANPDYKIYLRHHPYIPCWDTNLYCK
ncbi:MAG: FkbM family methyltransferase [Ruminococcus sp.]